MHPARIIGSRSGSGQGITPPSDSSHVRFDVDHDVDEDEWQSLADRCSFATFFHTPLWLRLFTQTRPQVRIATKKFRFEEDKVAIFPLLERNRLMGLSRVHTSTAASCYGGWVCADTLFPEQILAMTRWIFDHCGNLVWRVNPLQPLVDLLDPFTTELDTTEILDLSPFEDENALRMHYKHSVRKQVNKGIRAGLRAAPAETWEEWEQYFAIYQKRLQGWGAGATSRYSIDLFRSIFDAQSPSVKLWVASKDGEIIGGNLNFYHGRHCVEWHAAYNEAYFACGVRDFLVDWIIQDARVRGFTYYDFNPSGGHEGARQFKQTFGTTSMPSNLIVRRQGLYRMESLRKAYRRMGRLRGAS